MIPATALRAAPSGVLVERRGGAVLHVYAGPLTAGARTRRGRRPVCNQPASATSSWRAATTVDLTDRLCGRCARWATKRLPAVALQPFTVDDIVASLVAASCDAEVEACADAAAIAGLSEERVSDGRRLRAVINSYRGIDKRTREERPYLQGLAYRLGFGDDLELARLHLAPEVAA